VSDNDHEHRWKRHSVCPGCGFGYRPGVTECPECGLAVTSEEKALKGQIHPVCPECGLELPYAHTWCRRCGQDLKTGGVKVLVNPMYCILCAGIPALGVIAGLGIIFTENRAFKKLMIACFWSAALGFILQQMIFGEVFFWPEPEQAAVTPPPAG